MVHSVMKFVTSSRVVGYFVTVLNASLCDVAAQVLMQIVQVESEMNVSHQTCNYNLT